METIFIRVIVCGIKSSQNQRTANLYIFFCSEGLPSLIADRAKTIKWQQIMNLTDNCLFINMIVNEKPIATILAG